jgi:TubC N-terminal docking domain
MTAGDTILAELRRRGVEVVAAGDKIRWRPKEAVPDTLRAAIVQHKPELLATLTVPAVRRLYPETMAEVLGPAPEASAVAAVRCEVAAAVCELRAEIETGQLLPRCLLVRGRPLAEWLDLDDVAALLRAWDWFTRP